MDLKVKKWKDLTAEEENQIFRRSELDIHAILPQVQEMIDRVKSEGDKALIEMAFDLDKAHLQNLEVSAQEWEEGAASLSQEVKDALDFVMDNVRRFHEIQVPKSMEMVEVRPGVWAGEKASPIDSVGLYVPQGRGRFPSMLYMLSIPAQMAKVPKIMVTTPPNPEGKVDPAVLYAAKASGVHRIFKVGGAGAIAALTYGTQTIPAVPKIMGPGSMWATAAKRILSSMVDVGLPAGPTESLILADEQANPWKVALDLLVEAEHGSDSAALLLTPSVQLANEVLENVLTLLHKLPEPRKRFAQDVLQNYGGIFLVDSLEKGIEISNRYAPEHLLLHTQEPFDTLTHIQNASEILLGSNLPFSMANYATGPNAVLPTGGKAKTYSPVSLRDFLKYSSVIYTTKTGYDSLKDSVMVLSEYEGFPAHKGAVELREKKEP